MSEGLATPSGGSRSGPIVFFGSPAFAVPTLAALVERGYVPELVVSQPARPAGRGRRELQPAVAAWALERGLPLAQPERVRAPEFLDRMRELDPWVAVVVAFGQIFPQSLLDIPRAGCVNLHGSLLPRHRGAAPIQAAIAAGDAVTGVTTMRMERGLDSGPMLLRRGVEITPGEATPELAERLSTIGAELMVETLEGLAAGELVPEAQDEAEVTYAPQIAKQDGRVDWSAAASRIERLLRAYTPWPGLTAELAGRPLKLVRLKVAETERSAEAPGTVVAIADGAVRVACGDGTVLSVESMQRPGKRPVSGRDLMNGERLAVGERFS